MMMIAARRIGSFFFLLKAIGSVSRLAVICVFAK